ncbi:MAG: hypothetical protein ACYDA3_03020 [Gaiellaceae bacterium]
MARPQREARSLNDRATLFAGLGTADACCHTPPDVSIAAGGGYVVELANSARRVWSAGGTVLESASSLSQMFGTGTDPISDPKIIFDAATGRFFASEMDESTGTVIVATSATSNPLVGWVLLTVNAGPGIGCIDQPKLGTSDSVLVLTGNAYSGPCSALASASYLGGVIWVLNKQEMLQPGFTHWSYWGPSYSYSAPIAAQAMSSTGVAYAASSGSRLNVYTISGTPPGGTSLTTAMPSTPSFVNSVPEAVQPSNNPVATNDSRLLDAFWLNGDLWLAGNDQCANQGLARACARVLDVKTSLSSVAYNGWYAFTNSDAYYPALRPDGLGNVVLVFGFSSSSDYPSVAMDEYRGGSWVGSSYVQKGSAATSDTRWGDYFGAATDPSTPGVVWVAGEYGGGGVGWSTAVAAWKTVAVSPVVEYANPSSTSVGATSAALAGVLDPRGSDSQYWFEYGTSTAYGQSTQPTAAAASTGRVVVTGALSTLTPGTTYNWRLVATNAGGKANGADQTFTTLALPEISYSNPSAVRVTTTTATLVANLNPHGAATNFAFEYGPTAAYGATAGAGSSSAATWTQASASLTGLASGTTYHFRLAATSSAGPAAGIDQTFRTTKAAPKRTLKPKPKPKPKKKPKL